MTDIQTKPQLKYFDLLINVGTHHCYQYLLILICFYAFSLMSIAVSSLTYLFMNHQFDCPSLGIETTDCESYICEEYKTQQLSSLPFTHKYNTIATEFGPFYCNHNIQLGFYRSFQSIGSFVGILLAVVASDNYSRLMTLKVLSLVFISASIILPLSRSIIMACISLFFIGFSVVPMTKILLTIISEQVEKTLMKRFVSVCLFGYMIIETATGPMFEALDSWRKFFIVYSIIPGSIFLILVFCVVQDSPKFLLQKGQDQAIESLNRIARINQVQIRYVQGDLTEYIQYEAQYQTIKRQMTPYDLLRYKSLRRAAITLSIGYFSVNFIYYGLSSTTDKIGYNPILNGVLLGIGSLIGIPVSFLMANRTPRRGYEIFYNLFSGVCSLIIFFIKVPTNCEFCSQNTAEIVLMIVMRLTNVVQNQVLFLHLIQSFPSAIRTIGIGLPTLVGSIGLFCSQFVIVGLFEISLKLPFAIISICSILFGINYYFAPETLNSPLKEQIDEIEQQAVMKDIKDHHDD